VSFDGLLPMLVSFAAWRTCRCCGSQTLYIDARCQTGDDCVCGLCERAAELLLLSPAAVELAIDRATGSAGVVR
jgi:hypothetical protein